MQIRDRIKELRRVPASQLRPNPKNWRTHPQEQADALRGVLAEVGIADACIAREMPDGSLMLLDGHLRTETLGGELVPVLVLDVNEEEADKILATLDPLAELAKADEAKLADLLQTITTESEALESMLSSMIDLDELELNDNSENKEQDNLDNSDEPNEPPPSGVRMVQLFLDETNIEEFQDACAKLAKAYATENITDTVLEAIRRESSSL